MKKEVVITVISSGEAFILQHEDQNASKGFSVLVVEASKLDFSEISTARLTEDGDLEILLDFEKEEDRIFVLYFDKETALNLWPEMKGLREVDILARHRELLKAVIPI